MEEHEYIYTKTDVDLSTYDIFNKNPSVREIMEELEKDCILEERETINTDPICGRPMVFSKFKCPIGTKEKCESYNVGIFRCTDERIWTKYNLARQEKLLQDFKNKSENEYTICSACIIL